jgi:hypothetical protein
MNEMISNIKGVVTEVTFTVSRKLTDGNYGSFEAAASLTVSVPSAETDVDDLMDQLDAYLTAKVGASAHQKEAIVKQHAPPSTKAPVAQTAPVAKSDNTPQQSAGMLEDGNVYREKDGKKQKFCPKHDYWMNERSNDKGSWFSHKVGDEWCKGE